MKISKIKLFTLSACPMGRSMHSVISEVITDIEGIKFDIVYVDIDSEQTNKYRVKANPTTLILNEKDQELYRIVGFKETHEVSEMIHDIEAGVLTPAEVYDENKDSQENYTIYLYKEGELASYLLTYVNKTSVRAPRITAIKQLMASRPNGYDNPFPLSSSLEAIDFNGKEARVSIQLNEPVSDHEMHRMNKALLRTLSHYDITNVSINLNLNSII